MPERKHRPHIRKEKLDNIRGNMKIVCVNCGAENPKDSNFCSGCGRHLKRKICVRCGTENADDAVYCRRCGMKLEGDVPEGYSTLPYRNMEGLTAPEFIFILLFSPLAGLIGFLIWYGEKPRKARQSLSIALVMFLFAMIIFLF
ncbi:zinc ribbon domain-containing protein [Methanothermobacter sp.]|uniref:zinc ribbon domain-containing protein n=1 Tax=Methanothermobacter sp. TaxID=1884223 RepID=UPI002610C2EC|nr:zinc ribbon domain-containing protein [Methanothermobacter sp.]MDI9618428.1 zinc ribbon domain-containing protein [Methanothermobacter sp.]